MGRPTSYSKAECYSGKVIKFWNAIIIFFLNFKEELEFLVVFHRHYISPWEIFLINSRFMRRHDKREIKVITISSSPGVAVLLYLLSSYVFYIALYQELYSSSLKSDIILPIGGLSFLIISRPNTYEPKQRNI